MTPTDALRQACEMLSAGDTASAKTALELGFAPLPASTMRSTWPKTRLVRTYVLHGFTDRYFGEPLVFLGTLRALSLLAPSIFPYHPNWKQSLTHAAYWSHYPSIDHIHAVARGGADAEENIVTPSMLHNAAKANWLPSELGWCNGDAPLLCDWDGLLPWFIGEYERNGDLRSHKSLQEWYRAAKIAA